MSILNQVFLKIIGDIDPILYIACVLVSYAGFALSQSYSVIMRDPNSKGTPVNFDWRTFWSENGPRIIFNVIFLPVVLIFSQQFIGSGLTTIVGLGAGIGADAIAKKMFNPAKRRNTEGE